MTIHVKIEYEWNDMNCKICARGQIKPWNVPLKQAHVSKCDLGVPGAWDHGYCPLFVAHAERVKSKADIVHMFENQVQRWIREKSDMA